ncbi:MAG TPA: DUF4242 domain-containing protein [Polyangiaceae bacterium]
MTTNTVRSPSLPTSGSVAAVRRKLYLDVHDLGPGKVHAEDVAGAHRLDLATQGKYGVSFKAYWVNEKRGKIYCLVEAPSAEAAAAVHREAHGLVAHAVMEVTADSAEWAPTPGKKLYLDVHRLGAGNVTPKAVAEAHKKDLETQGKHGVSYLNYWLDEQSGTVMCLVEAPSPDAAIEVHREAHGLIPDSIDEVIEGR